MVTPAAKREAVAHLGKVHEMSERRACRVVGCDRMTVRYRSRRADDPELRERLRALARERRRFGYRRLLIFLRREGFVVNHKRLFRIYREERLMVRKRGGRKRALGTRASMAIPAAPNDLWALDFVSDQFTCGRRFRILAVYDVCTRECLMQHDPQSETARTSPARAPDGFRDFCQIASNRDPSFASKSDPLRHGDGTVLRGTRARSVALAQRSEARGGRCGLPGRDDPFRRGF